MDAHDLDGALMTAKCCSFDHEFVAVLNGVLAGDAARDFGEILVLESWRGLDRIALDLRDVAHADLVGLAALWRVAESQREAGGTLEVQSIAPRVLRRFRSFGLIERVVVGQSGEIRSLLSHSKFEPGI